MAGFHLHTSNRLELLAAHLACVTAAPLASPLAREVVIVQSRGMARWASLQIAQHNGICMNFEFPFPRTFIARTLRAFFPDLADEEKLSAEVLTWRIHAALPRLAPRPEFAVVGRYLADGDALKTFQLAGRIANLFDQYLLYRPEMILRWERDRAERDWQAVLWRDLIGGERPLHLAAIHESLAERMAASPAHDFLPERVSIFGISSLPPLYLRVFFELARHGDVHLFSLQPSQEYFGHDLSPKRRARHAAGDEQPTGNPLLTSLGRLHREATEVRLELDERAGFLVQEDDGQFVEPGDGCLLHALQSDLLHARNRGDGEQPKFNAAADDSSLALHSCHSPMREIEVLYDQLLAAFARDPQLRPRDIIVMAPDIEKYAPFIHAIFSYPEDPERAIPYSVADRLPQSESPTVEAFLALLALPGGRGTATEVFALLDRPPLRQRFGFTDEDLVLIRQWVTESGIRWGIDGAHRAQFDLPALEGNTWRFGLRRLLLGYAMAGGNRATFAGIMPYDEVEGGGAEVLGRFVTAVEAIFGAMATLPQPRALADWPDALGQVVDQFFAAETPDQSVIRHALEQLRRTAEISDAQQEITFAVIRAHVQEILSGGEGRGGFLTGGVTFCALQPMRSIPARMICLIGLGDQDFPRPSHTPGFDLIAAHRQSGDRSPRDDDRSVFLEALISARERFHCSYVGHSVTDNEEIPPSVLVSELLDYLDGAVTFPAGKTARAALVTEHRLHAFSPRYFDGKTPALFSYSAANAAASQSLHANAHTQPPAFFPGPLPAPNEESRQVEVKTLLDFFSHPAKHFVRHRLGLRLEDEDDTLADSEPFDLGHLARYFLKQEMVAQSLGDQSAQAEEFVARGALPLGEIGAARFHTLRREAEEFSMTVRKQLAGRQPTAPRLVHLTLGLFVLTGKIESNYDDGIVHFRCANLKPKDRIRAWLTHLLACATQPTRPSETLLIGEDETLQFAPVEGAAALLENLLELYWRGLACVLPFFPGASLAYAQAEHAPAKSAPIDKARRVWHSSPFSRGEQDDVYHQFCFAERDPLDTEFAALAVEIFGPMLRHETAVA